MGNVVIRLSASGAELNGTTLDAGRNDVRVRVADRDAEAGMPAAGTAVQVFMVAGESLYSAPAQVATIDGAVLRLHLDGTARQFIRREKRRECRMPVAVRPLRKEGPGGAWRAAIALDLSPGGMRLASLTALPAGQVEVLYNLAECRVDDGSRLETRGAAGQAPTLTQARIVHSRSLPNGEFVCGVRFTSLDPTARVALLAFCSPQARKSD